MSVGHYENFPVASRLVPAALRPAVVAIYRFARSADDIADEGDASDAQRLAALASYDAALDAIARGDTPSTAPFPEVAEAIRAHELPIDLFHALISAFRQDVTTKRYATYADVRDYCARSANPVGRLLLALYRRQGDDNLRWSDAICTGLQLTNFWQDVASDWQRGRIYVPAEDLARFGVTETQIADAQADDAWRALSAHETARTRVLIESGRPLVRALPWRIGLELSAVIAGGLTILDRIDAVGGDVFRRRPQLAGRDWLTVGCRALVPGRFSAPAPA